MCSSDSHHLIVVFSLVSCLAGKEGISRHKALPVSALGKAGFRDLLRFRKGERKIVYMLN